ncbi:MAG: DUF488 domain-containing protein [Thermomicrobium sp.]|nr:DUF488 domain-containing protein [Thermomicrobium sp.]MDW8006105.1 DUF488 domain-containing protein [Thermomicrobium sp.]
MANDRGERFDVYTIGHSNHEFEDFVSVLEDLGIRVLVDVRSHPNSGYPEHFHQRKLESKLRERPIRYVYLGGCLGGRPGEAAAYEVDRVDYERLRRTKAFQDGIEQLRRLVREYGSGTVCVMCVEADPLQCHRFYAVGEELWARGRSVGHIEVHRKKEQDQRASGQAAGQHGGASLGFTLRSHEALRQGFASRAIQRGLWDRDPPPATENEEEWIRWAMNHEGRTIAWNRK